jgi:hypothetical protein
MRLGCLFLFSSVGNCWMFNLRSGGTLRWKAEDRQLGRSGIVMWKVDTSKILAPVYVG